jgi:hypothetical protein
MGVIAPGRLSSKQIQQRQPRGDILATTKVRTSRSTGTVLYIAALLRIIEAVRAGSSQA